MDESVSSLEEAQDKAEALDSERLEEECEDLVRRYRRKYRGLLEETMLSNR